jgi:hypothetical protein
MNNKRLSKEIWVILSACSKALSRESNIFSISLNRNHVVLANKYHGKGINRDRLSFALKWCIDNGFLIFYKGYKSQISCYELTDKMLERFSTKSLGKMVIRPKEDLVVVKNDKKEIIQSKISGITSSRSLVKKYNTFLDKQDIRLNNIKCSPEYKRIFNNNLNCGGRWYTFGGFQSLPSENRRFITINSNQTTEVDFKSIHPNILYTLEGIDKGSTFDPYSLSGLCLEGSPQQIRALAKGSLLRLMNSKTVGLAYNSVRLYCSEIKFPYNKGLEKQVIDELINNNAEIKDYLLSEDIWKELQYLDSSITESIIKSFLDEDKVILPWHDSYVVCQQEQEFLIEVMKSSWKEVLGTDINFKYKVEF